MYRKDLRVLSTFSVWLLVVLLSGFGVVSGFVPGALCAFMQAIIAARRAWGLSQVKILFRRFRFVWSRQASGLVLISL